VVIGAYVATQLIVTGEVDGEAALRAGLASALSAGVANQVPNWTSDPTGQWVIGRLADGVAGTIREQSFAQALTWSIAGSAGAICGVMSEAAGYDPIAAAMTAQNAALFNRLLHPDQVVAIEKKAKELAGQEGLTEQQWEQRLLRQALKEGDSAYSDFAEDALARNVLAAIQAAGGPAMNYEGTAALPTMRSTPSTLNRCAAVECAPAVWGRWRAVLKFPLVSPASFDAMDEEIRS
jgi:hypothetical protein